MRSELPTINQLIARHEGGTLVAAIDAEDGTLKFINDTPSGLACAAICPVCERPLIAKKGSTQTHHFAHRPDEHSPACASAGETALHIFAKEIFAKEKWVHFPATFAEDHWGVQQVSNPGPVFFEEVELEKNFGNVIPDVVGHAAGRRLFIEVKVTHACPPEKLQKLAQLDVGVLEIDLSAYRDIPLNHLHNVILSSAPRSILQCRITEHGQKLLAQRDEKLSAEYRALIDAGTLKSLDSGIDVSEEHPLSPLVGRLWQEAIFGILKHSDGPRSVESIYSVLASKRHLDPTLSDREKTISAFCSRTNYSHFIDGRSRVENFLTECATKGTVARTVSGNWFIPQSPEADLETLILKVVKKLQDLRRELTGRFLYHLWLDHLANLRKQGAAPQSDDDVLLDAYEIVARLTENALLPIGDLSRSPCGSLLERRFYL